MLGFQAWDDTWYTCFIYAVDRRNTGLYAQRASAVLTELHPRPPTGISKKASRLLGQSSHRVAGPKNRGAREGWQGRSAPSAS